MRHRRPPRVPTFDYLGKHRYFLTMCVDRRRPIFVDQDVVDRIRRQILRTFIEQGLAVIAYTFMPDHVHLLVEGASVADFRGATRLVRRRSALTCPIEFRPLWQEGYHERVLRGQDDANPFVDYILNNPVKAGLVVRAADYPFSWSVRSSS